MDELEKLNMKSPDFTDQNIEKLAELFPNCVTEAKDAKGELQKSIDFDLLKQELSGSIVDGARERYQLNWPGKREALLTANTPITKTLRPCREESVDFDTTENLFIEGDNLDALKLLQETYLGKVKMIYIDPPYNTGKDFIYSDNFTVDKDEYDQLSEQKDEDGGRLVANTESNGRFHSDWLDMMYPRLKLARNLLIDDGVIFISIDEVEFANLQKISDEVFGRDNFISSFIWQNKKGGGNDSKFCAVEHEYIVVYAKNLELLPRLFEKFTKEYAKRYKEEDGEGKYFWDTFKRKSGKQYYSIICPDGTVLEKDGHGNPLSWLRSEMRFKNDVRKGDIKFAKRKSGWSIMFKQRIPKGKKPRSLVLNKGTTSDGSEELLLSFGVNLFSNPKPVSLLSYLGGIVLKDRDVVLDFFAGSATAAHAVMQLNAEENGNRKFIMVQLPEVTNEKSEAHKAGYSTIAEISKERIRRAGQKIKEDNADKEGIDQLDTGFRVLKIDSSNMKDVYYAPDVLKQQDLSGLADNIKDDRSAEDLLFQVLLDWGVDLSLPIRKETLTTEYTEHTEKKTKSFEVFFVDGNALLACFDTGITEDLIKGLAKREPLRAVFRDAGYASDSTKINIKQIFKLVSPQTEVKAI